MLNNANYFGGNQSLNRSRRLDATALYTFDRDTFTATVDYQRSSEVGNPAGLPTSLLTGYGLTPAIPQFRSGARHPVLHSGIPAPVPGGSAAFRASDDADQHEPGRRPDLAARSDARSHQPALCRLCQDRQAGTTGTDQQFALVSATLTYNFTATLTGHATFAGHYQTSGGNEVEFGRNFNDSDSTFTVSLTRTF
ncbi:MAG: hypothetical protein WDN04_06550 [Rhodospirillales bacterium]